MNQAQSPQAYEPPDDQRPASASPSELQLRSSASTAHDPYAAFRLRDYRLFIVSFFVSIIGSQVMGVTALYEVYKKTGSPLSLGWVGLALAVPMLLLSLPAGQFADNHSRKRIVMVSLLLSATCAVGLGYLSHFHSEWKHSVKAMYVILAVNNACATFGRPARAALLPQLVPPGILNNAITWNSSIFETASMIGPAMGGFMCARSIPAAYALAAGCWVVCFFLTAALPDRPLQARNGSKTGLADLIAGVRFVWRVRLMLGVMVLDLFAVLLGGATFLLPAFARDILHVGATGYGWLRAAPAIGALSMAIIQAHRRPYRRAGRALLLAVCGFGAATIIFGLSRNYWLSLAMLVLTGAFDNVSVVIRHTLIQLLTPDHMRGRVSAVNQIFIGSSNELGGLESGLTAAWFGLAPSVVLGGIGTIGVVVAVAARWPEIRRLGSLRDIQPVIIEVSESPATKPATHPAASP